VFTNSTVSGNKAFRDGGGVSVHGRLRLVNCTISNNTAAGLGGGIYVRGPLDYLNTIIANNGGREGECVVDSTFMGTGSVGRNSHNLVEDKTCDPDHWGDPVLGPLADNGAGVLTHALLPGSPAIDAVPVISCTVPTDQRGVLRPVVQTSHETPCDIGAYEAQGEE
jgi:predicted outer membrane repeat protein